MMNKNILKKYFLLSFFVFFASYLTLGFSQFEYYKNDFILFCINFLYGFTYSLILFFFIFIRKPNLRSILIISFIYLFFFGFIYIYMIYDFSGFFFQFIPSDSPMYHQFGLDVSRTNIFSGIRYLTEVTKYGFSDMGMVFYVSVIYKFIDSPLFLKFVNLLLNIASTFIIYKISIRFLSNKYSLICSLLFSISSINLWFLISGLKEPLMILIILISFYYYLLYQENKFTRNLLLSIFFSFLLIFFRIPLFVMFLISILLSELNLRRISISGLIAFALILSFTLYVLLINYDIIYWYSIRQNWSFVENEFKANNYNYLLSFMSGVYGPLPTITPNLIHNYHDVSVYASSLIFKMFLGTFFILSPYFIIKEKKQVLYPILFFTLFHVFSLFFIEQTFKLRFAMPHIIFYYMLSFFVIEKIESSNFKYNIVFYFNNISYVVFFFLIIFWNVLRT